MVMLYFPRTGGSKSSIFEVIFVLTEMADAMPRIGVDFSTDRASAPAE